MRVFLLTHHNPILPVYYHSPVTNIYIILECINTILRIAGYHHHRRHRTVWTKQSEGERGKQKLVVVIALHIAWNWMDVVCPFRSYFFSASLLGMILSCILSHIFNIITQCEYNMCVTVNAATIPMSVYLL